MTRETEDGVNLVIKDPFGQHTTGIGISNVVARIYSYYGKGTKIYLENELGAGCKFVFELLCLEGKKHENYNSGG